MENHDIDINGEKSEVKYGLCFAEGTYRELFKPPTKKKNALDISWPDQDGTQVDNGSNYYESIALAIPVFIKAATPAALMVNFIAFTDLLKSGSTLTLDVHFYNRRFVLRYVETADLVWGDNVVRMVLNLVNDFPTAKTPIQ